MPGPNEALRDVAPALIVADDAAAAARIERAVGSALVARRVAWTDAPTIIGDHPAIAVVLADASGVPDAILLPGLAGVAAAAGSIGARLIAGFGRDQIDDVAGVLLGSGIALLCEPDPAGWAVETALALTERSLVFNDRSRGDERYRRLSEEVARIADVLTRLSLDGPGDGAAGMPLSDPYVGDPTTGYDAPPPSDVNPADIRRTIRARRMRDDAFETSGLFEDPAWDMLLDLFAAELERRRVSVSSLCIAAAVAPTTALRWIGKLIDAQLLERRADELDRRRAFISLTARASAAMHRYTASVRRTGLPIA